MRQAAQVSLLVGVSSILAQAGASFQESWRWARFTTESGLPSNRVHSVVDASDGVVWAGTEKGLAWYDGYSWHPANAAGGFPEKRPSALVAAPDGDILAIFDSVLYRGNRWSLRRVNLLHEGATLRSNSVAVLPDARVVVETNRGIYYLTPDGKVTPEASLPPAGGGTGHKIFPTRGPGVWFFAQSELFRWVGAKPQPWFRPGDLGLKDVSGSNLRVRALKSAADGSGLASISFPMESRGLWEWTANGRPARAASEGNAVVRSIDLAPSGEAIAAYESGDIRVRTNGKWFTLDPAPDPMLNVIFFAYRPNEDLWVGTDNGLYLYKRSSQRWTRWQFPFPDLRNNVDEILQTRDGSVWLATGDGVVVRDAAGAVKTFQWVAGKQIDIVTGLGQDREGNVWVSSGTSFEGAYRFDGRSWKHFGSPEGLFQSRIAKIRQDAKGRLWFLSAAEIEEPGKVTGAAVLENGKFTIWKREPGTLPGGVQSFADAPDGTLWFATTTGLSRWRNGQWRHWTKDNGVLGNTLAVAVDSTNHVWFGGRASGVGYLDGQDQPHYLSTADGVPGANVWDLRFDRQGTLWVTTESGLGSYRNGVWSRFQNSSGLLNPRLWPVLPANGKVYVGTIGSGVYILDLNDGSNPGPRVELSRPFVEDTHLLVRWSALGYFGEQPSESIETRYRLDNGAWSEWNTRRELRLNDLSPGDHRFQIQAKGLFGAYDTAGGAATFAVSPPLYRRPAVLVPISVSMLAALILSFALIWRRIQHRRALEESEARYRAVVEDQSEFICRFLPDGTLTFLNEAYCRYLGRRREDLIGHSLTEVLPPEEARGWRRRISVLRPDNTAATFEDRVETPDGSLRYQRWSDRAFFDLEGRCLEYQSVGGDVTARKKAEEELRASEERFRQLAGHLRQVFFITDPAWSEFLYISPAFEQVFDRSCESLYGNPRAWLECVHPDDQAQVAAPSGYAAERKLEYRIVRPSGEVRWIRTQSYALADEEGRIYRIVGLAEDITEWRALEGQLVQAQKMEAVGQLAGGVAHDFNNLLTVIQGHADLLRNRLEGNLKARGHADQILIASQRATALTQQLLAFSRRQILQPAVFSLNDVVADVESMLGRLLGEDIQVVTRLERELGHVRADRGQLGQVLINLAVNARDAMPGGGRIVIETANVTLTHPPSGGYEQFQPGSYVKLSVADTGAGMDENTAARVFEPFFTTKSKGKGTGLGLSTAYGIIKQSGGYIGLHTMLGRGTTFEVLLPQAVTEPGDLPQPAGSDAPAGKETVLLVEDEDGVRKLVAQLLEDHGYRVIPAANGQEALQVCESRDQHIDLMLSDVVMPQMSGRELGSRVSSLRPDIKILYMSGYTDDKISRHGVLDPDTAFIQKPFSLIALAQKVRDVLDGEPQAISSGR